MLNRKGFTLIELLIVVVIIGILAAIAIPKFANTKQKAIVASMKSDLRNLVTAQEAFFADRNTYAGTVAATQTATAAAFVASTGNTVTFVTNTAAGWSATVTNATLPAAATPRTCGIFVGNSAPPNAAVTNEGAPGCW
jgi:prepilin-type N-terminal cleavage/methylation domain-containing protein